MTAIGPGTLVKLVKPITHDNFGYTPPMSVGSVWTVKEFIPADSRWKGLWVLVDYISLFEWPEHDRCFSADYFAPFEPEAEAFRERARKAPAPIDG